MKTNKNFKRYWRQRRDDRKKEEKKIASTLTGLVDKKTRLTNVVSQKMISTIKSTIHSAAVDKKPTSIGTKIQRKLDDTLSTIGDQENIRDSFADILSGNFKINNIKRTKKQE